ncbi:MAG: hypothetical protein ACOX69_02530 [Coriobacteriales bacterium]|jgi:hypothetical protein
MRKIPLIKKLAKKATAFVCAAAFACALTPAAAFAEATNSTTGPDNVITISWTETDEANDTTVSCSDTVDLDTLTANTTDKGALYYKNGSWRVVNTDNYLTLSQVFAAATDTVDGTTYHASDVWNDSTSSSTSLSFTAWNYDDTTATWSVSDYSKYTNFTKGNIDSSKYFYGDCAGSTNGTTNNASAAISGGIIALSTATTTTTSTVTANDALDTVTSTSDSPRFMMGQTGTGTSVDCGGNRFPSNIESITIS